MIVRKFCLYACKTFRAPNRSLILFKSEYKKKRNNSPEILFRGDFLPHNTLTDANKKRNTIKSLRFDSI